MIANRNALLNFKHAHASNTNIRLGINKISSPSPPHARHTNSGNSNEKIWRIEPQGDNLRDHLNFDRAVVGFGGLGIEIQILGNGYL